MMLGLNVSVLARLNKPDAINNIQQTLTIRSEAELFSLRLMFEIF